MNLVFRDRNLRQADFCVASLVDGEFTNRVAVCIDDGDFAVANVGLVNQIVVVAAKRCGQSDFSVSAGGLVSGKFAECGAFGIFNRQLAVADICVGDITSVVNQIADVISLL